MPRRRRIYFPGATYHVLLRGNNKQDTFTCDRERYRFYSLLGEGVERFGHSVLAFCLMSNHIHLAVRVDEVSLAEIIQNLSFRYTRYFNYMHDRVGHLFQGRYKALLVDSHAYLRELIRYIHLNPVRAKLVSDPADFTWSGHRAYLGEQNVPWLDMECGLEHFGDAGMDAVADYMAFVKHGMDPSTSASFEPDSWRGIIGDREFVSAISERVTKPTRRKQADLELLLSLVCNWFEVEPAALRRSDYRSSYFRAVIAFLARRTVGVSIREVADFLGLEASGLSKAASRLEAKMQHSRVVKQEVEQLVESLPEEDNI